MGDTEFGGLNTDPNRTHGGKIYAICMSSEKGEKDMATDVREARRRKILDRGSDRLALITGQIQTFPPSSSQEENSTISGSDLPSRVVIPSDPDLQSNVSNPTTGTDSIFPSIFCCISWEKYFFKIAGWIYSVGLANCGLEFWLPRFLVTECFAFTKIQQYRKSLTVENVLLGIMIVSRKRSFSFYDEFSFRNYMSPVKIS